ncbi:MAG: SGNH/GDSL hydrolase family protein [bacterium]
MPGDIIVCVAAIILPVFFAAGLVRFADAEITVRPLRLLFGNLLVLGLLLSGIFLLGETYYRFIYDQPDPYGVTRAGNRWFVRHFRSNMLGFRDNIEYDFAFSPGRKRVSFLGDSFTAGHGIKDPEDRLANLVRKWTGWEVHIISQCGWDTAHEISAVQKLIGMGYQFDTVALMYCLNDVAALMPEHKKAGQWIFSILDTEGFLVRHSYFVNTLYYRLRLQRYPELADYYGYVRRGYESNVWEKQEQQLTFLRDLLASRNAKLVVLVYPFFHLLGSDYPYAGAHAKISEWCRLSGVPCLDLLDVYGKHHPRELMLNSFDAHPNEKANALSVKPVVRFIETAYPQRFPVK